MTIDEKFDLILKKIEQIEKQLQGKQDLTKRSNVKEYLNISEGTLNNYMKDGRFKQGVHYTKEFKGLKSKIVFIESAIINFKGIK